ncbi:MAG: acyl-CoA thioesterase domain-containing protein, partial [Streptosporangiaceae bacterium]
MDPYFTLIGEDLVPAPHARSPWSADMLHGRLLGGLLARAIERDHGADELSFARLTVDLFRNAPLTPLKITTDRVREGRRIRVADASVSGADGAIARASAVLLRKDGQPDGETWPPQTWNVPGPEELTLAAPPAEGEPPFKIWWIGEGGNWNGGHQRRCWLQETRRLVAGEDLSPFVRVVLAADLASPLSHWSTTGLHFINADYTINLSR